MDSRLSTTQSEVVAAPAGKGSEPEVSPAVRFAETSKHFLGVVAVDEVSLDIYPRELFTLLGPSGSGKTTLLRMIAGLVQPTSGRIYIGDEEVHARPTHERNIGMVFQSLALFPHMDVFSNIAFPLRMRRRGKREIARRVKSALDVVRLPDIGRRRVSELSGGQQQRVALARALVYDPQLLLLDEPFGALDRHLREEMQLEVVRIHAEIDVTIINVTHDQREALMLSDRIGVMREGQIEQVGSSEEIYRRPSSHFVAGFIGDANLLEGRAVESGEQIIITTSGGAVVSIGGVQPDLVDRRCAVAVRPEVIEVARSRCENEGMNCFAGTVALGVFQGSAFYYEIESPALGTRLKVSRPASVQRSPFAVGDHVTVCWDPADTVAVLLD